MASTLDMFLAWWRSRGNRPSAPARLREFQAAGPTALDEQVSAGYAADALRQFLSLALDDRPAVSVMEEDDPAQRALIESASAALSRLEVQARYLPRRPSLLPKLLSAMNSDANSMRELASIIGGDPALLGNLLRVANSAFFRSNHRPVESLERAVVLVGTDGIRSLIASALLHPVMSTGRGWYAGFPEAIWEQTQFAAEAAELHALRVERVDGFGARLLALLHGLATNTVFRIVRDEALVQPDAALKPAIIDLLEQWVTPTALRIAESWQLADDLRRALDAPLAANALARSLYFGRLAGSQVVLIRRGRLKESSARATVLAGDTRRMQVDRVWGRLAAACLAAR